MSQRIWAQIVKEPVKNNILEVLNSLLESLNTSHMRTDMSTILPEKETNVSNMLLTSQRTEKSETPLLYVHIEDENEVNFPR